MRRLLLLATLAGLVGLATATTAAAKGPTAAKLSGPGLGKPLPVKGDGEGGPGSPLGSLVELGGYFPQTFGQSPDPTIQTRPAGDLGARYVVVYRVPGPSSGLNKLIQEVYPYAKPHPLTHMRAGQLFWDGERTHGGWFVSTAALKATLVKAGLPASPPRTSRASRASRTSFPWGWTGTGAAAALVLLVLALRRSNTKRLKAVRSSA